MYAMLSGLSDFLRVMCFCLILYMGMLCWDHQLCTSPSWKCCSDQWRAVDLPQVQTTCLLSKAVTAKQSSLDDKSGTDLGIVIVQ